MTPSAEVSLTILDSDFRVVSDDERIVDLTRELWAPFVTSPTGEPAEVRVTVWGDRWHLQVPGDPAITAADPWLLASSLRNALSRRAIAAADTVLPLHAAAVERDGKFVVLSGPPRTGKTTLLLELLESGWLLVTDDLVPVDPETFAAAPFPKPLSVRDPERWRFAARRWSVPEWLPRPETVGLIPAARMPVTSVATYSPSALVFSRYETGAEPSFERLTPAQTVAWCGDNLHTRRPEAPGVLRVVARLGAATPGFAIRYGSSPDALELVEKCLAALDSME